MARPNIRAEVTRQILFESGHRCAVCGDSCPLERAHIIPWRTSKAHRQEDLICLCASCHQRADLEGWGEQTLRLYKEKPWILRKREQLDSAIPRAVPADACPVVELTRLVDLSYERWHGLLQPKAILDIWVKYEGPGQLFLDSVKLFHIESSCESAASGAFPPSARYRLGYTPGSSTDFPLRPPLLINPTDQKEIHFELEIYPEGVVSGVSACVAFLLVRSDLGLAGRLPLFSPRPHHILASRILRRHVRLNSALYRDYLDIRNPVESVGGSLVLSPRGSVVCFLDGREPTDMIKFDRDIDVHFFKERVRDLEQFALDPAESECVAEAAIELLWQVGGKDAEKALRSIAEKSLSSGRRSAANRVLKTGYDG